MAHGLWFYAWSDDTHAHVPRTRTRALKKKFTARLLQERAKFNKLFKDEEAASQAFMKMESADNVTKAKVAHTSTRAPLSVCRSTIHPSPVAVHSTASTTTAIIRLYNHEHDNDDDHHRRSHMDDRARQGH